MYVGLGVTSGQSNMALQPESRSEKRNIIFTATPLPCPRISVPPLHGIFMDCSPCGGRRFVVVFCAASSCVYATRELRTSNGVIRRNNASKLVRNGRVLSSIYMATSLGFLKGADRINESKDGCAKIAPC